MILLKSKGPAMQLLFLMANFTIPLRALLWVARKSMGVLTFLRWTWWAMANLLTLGSTMLRMTRLGRAPLTILTVLEFDVVAVILNLVKRRDVMSSLWTDGLLLIIITDVLTGPSTAISPI